jgi:hypothetical protein
MKSLVVLAGLSLAAMSACSNDAASTSDTQTSDAANGDQDQGAGGSSVDARPNSLDGATEEAAMAEEGGSGLYPPLACLAPCIWDVIKRCVIKPPCTESTQGNQTTGCEPSGVRWVETIDIEGTLHRTVYFPDGSICYTGIFGPSWSWDNGSGTVVTATLLGPGKEETTCGGQTYQFSYGREQCGDFYTGTCTTGSCT